MVHLVRTTSFVGPGCVHARSLARLSLGDTLFLLNMLVSFDPKDTRSSVLLGTGIACSCTRCNGLGLLARTADERALVLPRPGFGLLLQDAGAASMISSLPSSELPTDVCVLITVTRGKTAAGRLRIS